jgi:hypothetical protein
LNYYAPIRGAEGNEMTRATIDKIIGILDTRYRLSKDGGLCDEVVDKLYALLAAAPPAAAPVETQEWGPWEDVTDWSALAAGWEVKHSDQSEVRKLVKYCRGFHFDYWILDNAKEANTQRDWQFRRPVPPQAKGVHIESDAADHHDEIQKFFDTRKAK